MPSRLAALGSRKLHIASYTYSGDGANVRFRSLNSPFWIARRQPRSGRVSHPLMKHRPLEMCI